jgi:glycosyltransferase involved in cell wall biosynthesis
MGADPSTILSSVRTFASADTFLESSQGALRLGRLVANATFLEALLRHGPYDRFEFFCPTDAERSRLRDWIERLPDGRNLSQRIDLRSPFDLPARMAVADWEVVHSGGWSRYLPALAWLRTRFANRAFPLTGTIHSLNDPSMAQMLRRLREAPLGSFDAVVCTSLDGRESFRRQLGMVPAAEPFAGRLEIAPLGVDDRYFEVRDKIDSRQKLAIPAQARVALWLGRLSAASKADLHPLLYQWMRIVRDAGSSERILVLAGGGSEGDVRSLRATVSELGLDAHVKIRPDIEDHEKLDLLAGADVFVSPVDNQQETFGIAVVEAMAAGLPVVASRWDGYKDLVDDGSTGILVPVRWAPLPPEVAALRAILEPGIGQLATSQAVAVDPGALRAALAALLDDRELSRRMGEAGRRRASETYSWESVIRRLSGLWRELKREAAGSDIPGRGRGGDPEIVDLASAFGHYGAADLETDFVVGVSELGRSILAGKVPMPPTFGELMPISDGKLLTSLVLELSSGRRSASDHVRICAARTGATEPQARWLLHWLLKYGVLEA